MRKHIVLVVLVVFSALLSWYLWSQKEMWNPGMRGLKSANAPRPASPGNSQTVPAAGQSVQDGGSRPSVDAKLATLRGLAKLSNRPIEFYGQVVDQNRNPVSGVKVTLQIRTMKEARPGTFAELFDEAVTATDSSGHFALAGGSGSVLTVKALEKDGYEPSRHATNRSYRYWDNEEMRFKPDPARAEVFQMWKKAGAEKLIVQSKMMRIPYDGTSQAIDLVTGAQVASGGDLRLTLERFPRQITYGQRNYEWNLTIEAIAGGVLVTNDEPMYQAPADGYQPKIVIHMPSGAPDWTDEKSVALYFTSRGGKHFGSVTLDAMVGSDKPTTGISFRSFLNPSGSRNLEYDPLQNVAKPAGTTARP